MNEFQKKFLLKRQDYGLLYPYLIEETVTDINWNGRQLWIDDLEKGRYMASEVLADDFVERFSSLLANLTNQSFNKINPVLEVETGELRISMVHQSVVHTGITITLRKIPAVRRLEKGDMVANGYCSEEILNFLIQCITAHCSVAICGLPGAGKTELLKHLTQYIPAAERAVTIEDVLEIHYREINPNKDCVEMKVAENFTYSEAIKTCLRQIPHWIILSEAKSTEVRHLLEALSIGTSVLTTLHTDDVRNIPERIKHMSGGEEDIVRIEHDIYRYIDVGILVKSICAGRGLVRRYIDQICIFDHFGRKWNEAVNQVTMIVEDGEVVNRQLPDNLVKKFRVAGIEPDSNWRVG